MSRPRFSVAVPPFQRHPSGTHFWISPGQYSLPVPGPPHWLVGRPTTCPLRRVLLRWRWLPGDDACALRIDSTVVCWGATGPTRPPPATRPPTPQVNTYPRGLLYDWLVNNLPAETGFASVAVAGDDACALRIDSTVVCIRICGQYLVADR